MAVYRWSLLALAVAAGGAQWAQASEQSESKGLIEDSKLNLLLRNSYWNRDYNEGKADQRIWGQGIIATFESGFTQGLVGFGVDAHGKLGIKLSGGGGTAGDYAGTGFMAAENDVNSKGVQPPRSHWSHAGGALKARFSNTVIKYGEQSPELPVLAYDGTRLLPQYFSGALITSKEIAGLELNAGHFTAENGAAFSSRDKGLSGDLDTINLFGGSYSFNDNLSASLYFSDVQDVAKKKYANIDYTLPLHDEQSLNFDFNIYKTDYDKKFVESYTESDDGPGVRESRDNTIFSLAGKYSFGPHALTLSYQQNSGDEGYQYDIGDGGGTIFLPNSYYSDFNAKHEKSAQLAYDLDFAQYGVPGLSWRSAFVYGWDIDTSSGGIKTADTDTSAKEREFFNQVQYVVQSGPAKDLSFKARNSINHADKSYSPDLVEWRLFIEYPLNIL